ncbi:hypothetical protein [Mammaliicoccus sp. N-M51]|uniref:hypothetical protein n=1 Tax=Mammaliicoccus sp. N-M51 TaxID=2898710 RepID=UPI001EFB7110|nr:hypothetical protein [Mammaliicoccus sp. N-M51]
MKTDKLYKEYLAENKRIDSEIASLEADRKAIVNELVAVEQEYGLATNNGDFDKAKEVFKEVEKAKEKLKEQENLIKIKQDTVPALKRQNKFKLLNSVNDLRLFYIDEAEVLKDKLNNAIQNYNDVIEQVKDLNTLYNSDLAKFDNLHHSLSYADKDLFKKQHGDWKYKTRHMIHHKDELEEVKIEKY